MHSLQVLRLVSPVSIGAVCIHMMAVRCVPTVMPHAPQYGKVRDDAVIVLQVANPSESRVLLEKVLTSVYEHDTPFNLLTLFTNAMVHSTDALRALLQHHSTELTCFRDIHIGLDVSNSYYARGFDAHPHVFTPHSPFAGPRHQYAQLSSVYRDFRSWITSRVAAGAHQRHVVPGTTHMHDHPSLTQLMVILRHSSPIFSKPHHMLHLPRLRIPQKHLCCGLTCPVRCNASCRQPPI